MKKQAKTKSSKSSNAQINIRPAADGVLIKPEEMMKKTASGILIPDAAKQEKATRGIVVAVGPGKINEDGKLLPMTVKVGQKVYFNPGWESEIELDEQKYYLVRESDVRAFIK